MVDVEKQIEYRRQGSAENWDVAVRLVKDGKSRHGLFFAHWALEKILKALVCRRTHDVPPKIHNLTRLSELADPTIINIVRQYLRNLAEQGILARMGVLFGSHASGHPSPWSDIDLLVVSAAFDGAFSRDAIDSLWYVAARTDSRIEPIPCGERQWEEDTATPIIEVARREGMQIVPDEKPRNEMP